MIAYNMKSTHDEKSYTKYNVENYSETKNNYSLLTCRNCCDLATKLLKSFQEKNQVNHQLSVRENSEMFTDMNYSYHDESKCYCSLPNCGK